MCIYHGGIRFLDIFERNKIELGVLPFFGFYGDEKTSPRHCNIPNIRKKIYHHKDDIIFALKSIL